MSTLVRFVQAAGGVQIVILAANLVLPRRLATREYLPRLSPILRQIFIVHWFYIGLVLAIFAAICLLFAPDLAGASSLGRALSASLAVFWTLRIGIQLCFYDREFRRRYRLANVAMTISIVFLATVFAAGALGLGR